MIESRLFVRAAALAALVSAGLASTACDEQAVNRSAAGRDLDQALALIEDAQLGYVPGAAGDEARDVEAYRQATLDRAIAPLENVISRGSPEQQAAAAMLRADIASARATHLAEQALDASRGVTLDARDLVSRLVELDARRVRVDLLERDLGPIVRRYRTAAEERTRTREQLNQRAAELRERLASLESRTAEARDASQTAMQRAASLDDRAFEARGEQRYDLEERAAEARREAAAAMADAEQLQVQDQTLRVDLAVLDQRIAALGDAAETLASRAEASTQRQSTLDTQKQEAVQAREQAVQALIDTLDRLTGRFNDDVTDPLTAAADQLRGAIDTLERVVGTASLSPERRTQVRLALLSRRLDLAHVLSHHAAAAAGFGGKIAILESAADRLPEAGPAIDLALTVLRERKAALTQATAEVAQAGRELAAELEDPAALRRLFPDGDHVDQLQSRLARLTAALNHYARRAESAAL